MGKREYWTGFKSESMDWVKARVGLGKRRVWTGFKAEKIGGGDGLGKREYGLGKARVWIG